MVKAGKSASRRLCAAAVWLACAGATGSATAAVIGHMTTPEALTDARIATLPAAQQAPWQAYLAHSRALAAADTAALAAERQGIAPPPDPVEKRHGGNGMDLDKPAAWYATDAARHIADVIVSFQTPAGGWGKNIERTGALRLRGQSYVATEEGYVGTIDNDATITEMRFLARVQAQAPGSGGQAWRASFLKGMRYLLASQYPNGGFPQIYPLEGSYHDAITYNDDALVQVAELLGSAAGRQGDYAFVPADAAAQARAGVDRAVALVLATQVVVDGKRTAWGQQIDVLTLAPAGARNFEPISLVSHESASLLSYLMTLPDPSPAVVTAVHAGFQWLQRVALRDIAWVNTPNGRQRVAQPGAGPLWSRYYDIPTMRPVFGDRDRSIHDDVNELSQERRDGYAWYGTWPEHALAVYAKWARQHPLAAATVPH